MKQKLPLEKTEPSFTFVGLGMGQHFVFNIQKGYNIQYIYTM